MEKTYAVTLGEGWHNLHHAYPYHYVSSEFGDFAQFNPTKFFIDCMTSVGPEAGTGCVGEGEGRATRLR